MLFQDDVLAPNDSPEAAQTTNDKMIDVMESKLLDLHEDKNCYLVAGEPKAVKKMRKKLERNPLKLYNKNMKEAKSNKYLGCLLAPSVRQFISGTVDSRINLAKRAIYEIRTIVEDSRADSI